MEPVKEEAKESIKEPLKSNLENKANPEQKKKRKSISFKLEFKEDEEEGLKFREENKKDNSKPQSIERSGTRKSTADKESAFIRNRKRFQSAEVSELKKYWQDHELEVEFEHEPEVIRNTKRNSMIGIGNLKLKNLTDEDSC
ncbi:MAG: hypothetical protein MJ252_23235 [archaeon]|nr:hypothetical protein [archaeon]